MKKETNELDFIFDLAKRNQICFATDNEDQLKSVVKWTGTRWISGEGSLKQCLVSEGEKIASARAMVSGMLGVLPPEDLSMEDKAFDFRRDLLPTPKKAIDVEGNLHEHDPAHLNTKCIKLDPDKKIPTPHWDKFLSDMCSKNGRRDESFEMYLTWILGFSLFGINDRKEFYILLGPGGNNGKSTLMGIMSHLLGDYFYTANQDVIVKSKDGKRSKFCFAPLAKKRFVCIPEIDAGSKLNIEDIKKITGRDELNGEFKFKDEFTFTPECKVFCCTNHLPEVDCKGALQAVRQRMRILRFEYTVPDHLVDRSLDEKLKAEAPGILAKLIRAAVDGYKKTPKTPDRVKNEELQEFENKDPLLSFLSLYKKDPTASIRSSEALSLYSEYLADCGETCSFQNTRSFTRALRERDSDILSKKIGPHSCLVGIDFNSPLNTEPPPPAPEPPKAPEKKAATKEEVMAVRTPGESIKKAADRMGVEIAERVISGGESFNEIMEELIKQLAPSQELLESKKYEMFLKVMGRSTNKETIRGSLLTLIDKFENSKS